MLVASTTKGHEMDLAMEQGRRKDGCMSAM